MAGEVLIGVQFNTPPPECRRIAHLDAVGGARVKRFEERFEPKRIRPGC